MTSLRGFYIDEERLLPELKALGLTDELAQKVLERFICNMPLKIFCDRLQVRAGREMTIISPARSSPDYIQASTSNFEVILNDSAPLYLSEIEIPKFSYAEPEKRLVIKARVDATAQDTQLQGQKTREPCK